MLHINQPTPLIIDCKPSLIFGFNGTSDPDDSLPVLLTCDGTNVAIESNIAPIPHLRGLVMCLPLLPSSLYRSDLHVSITLLAEGKANVFICSDDTTIYDADHELV